jgi:hypothetical protein
LTVRKWNTNRPRIRIATKTTINLSLGLIINSSKISETGPTKILEIQNAKNQVAREKISRVKPRKKPYTVEINITAMNP